MKRSEITVVGGTFNEAKVEALNKLTWLFSQSFKRDNDKIFILNHTTGKSDEYREHLRARLSNQSLEDQFSEGLLLDTCNEVKSQEDNKYKILDEFTRYANILTVGMTLEEAWKLLDKIKFNAAKRHLIQGWKEGIFHSQANNLTPEQALQANLDAMVPREKFSVNEAEVFNFRQDTNFGQYIYMLGLRLIQIHCEGETHLCVHFGRDGNDLYHIAECIGMGC